MKKIILLLTTVSLIFATSCKQDKMKNEEIKIPIANKVATKLEKHGDVRIEKKRMRKGMTRLQMSILKKY